MSGKYRDGTAIKSVYDQLVGIKTGDVAEVFSVDSFTGEVKPIRVTRMLISKVCCDHGMKVVTRVIDGKLHVRRVS